MNAYHLITLALPIAVPEAVVVEAIRPLATRQPGSWRRGSTVSAAAATAKAAELAWQRTRWEPDDRLDDSLSALCGNQQLARAAQAEGKRRRSSFRVP